MTLTREHLVELWRAGVAAVAPRDAVRRGTPLRTLGVPGRVVVVAAGKAAFGMAAGLADVLGREPDDGLVVVPYGSDGVSSLPVIEASHPLPDENSVRAGNAALRLAAAAGSDDLFVFLISGGASALLEAPVSSLDDVRSLTDRLLRSGADIHALNRLRTERSRLKGGGLARAASRCALLTLAISDVVGDDLGTIGSGPTAWDGHPNHVARVVASGRDAAQAVVDAAAGDGLSAVAVTTELAGEARVRGVEAASAAVPADVAVYAGETTVTVRGEGRGGRNQEAALAAALAIAGSPVLFLAAATDGVDGPTDAAGAIVDGDTVSRALSAGLDPADHLARNDSHSLLAASGDLIRTGPTGTNVADLWLVTGSQDAAIRPQLPRSDRGTR